MFALKQRFAGVEIQEVVIHMLRWLRSRVQFHFIRQQYKAIFDDPAVMKYRKNLTAIAVINKLRIRHGYKVVYAYGN